MFISKTGKPFKFISSKTVQAKSSGNFLTFVTVHNPDTYENLELLYDYNSTLPSFNQGDLVSLEIIPSVFQGKVSFKALLTPFSAKA